MPVNHCDSLVNAISKSAQTEITVYQRHTRSIISADFITD